MRHQQYEKDVDNKNYTPKAKHLETAKEEYVGPGARSDVYREP